MHQGGGDVALLMCLTRAEERFLHVSRDRAALVSSVWRTTVYGTHFLLFPFREGKYWEWAVSLLWSISLRRVAVKRCCYEPQYRAPHFVAWNVSATSAHCGWLSPPSALLRACGDLHVSLLAVCRLLGLAVAVYPALCGHCAVDVRGGLSANPVRHGPLCTERPGRGVQPRTSGADVMERQGSAGLPRAYSYLHPHKQV